MNFEWKPKLQSHLFGQSTELKSRFYVNGSLSTLGPVSPLSRVRASRPLTDQNISKQSIRDDDDDDDDDKDDDADEEYDREEYGDVYHVNLFAVMCEPPNDLSLCSQLVSITMAPILWVDYTF